MYLKQDHEIPFMINCSGRYLVQIYKEKMQEIKKRNPEAVGSWQKYINGQGGQLIDKFVLFEETESLLRSNLIGISDKLNPNIQVLTIFGALDKIIPLSDFGLWVDELGSKGTYQMIANADHNFYGVTSERINYNPQIAKQIRQFLDPKTIQERFYKKTTMVQSKRWIPIDGLENFRDLGGYSPRFPNGLIFRSADLRDLTVLGARQLSKHIAYVFDLRSNPEVHKNGTIGPQKHPIEIPDCERVHVPIFAETDYSPDKIQSRMKMYAQGAQGFLSAYIGVIHNLGPTLAKIFKILAQLILSKEHRGILIHCTAGKDRTGIVCALFLCLGGVAEETICQEYQLTEHGLKDNVDRLLKRIAVDDKEKETKIRNMMGAKAIAMRVTLDHLWKKHGGPIQYIRDRVDPKDFEIVHRTLNGAANL
ncbi:protein-tyrosine phosphatase-like protein [Gorgonomyces haynaldii]|nr:protein-tyrosine phosphatase-like protein [Gorgonomyces haynaldii]